jgi:hypothetical protein
MDASDDPGFWFRNTSLTMRLRFTPAMACSTRTRIWESLRLARFSTSVSSRPGGFFFRLAGLRHRRLIPLKSRVFVPGGSGRITQARVLRDPLLVSLAGVGLAQEQYPLVRGLHHQHVLVGVGLLPAAVVQGLFFGLFGPLPTPLRRVDDNQPGARGSGDRVANRPPSRSGRTPKSSSARRRTGRR